VVIKAEAKASEAIISVCDAGAGIASEDLPHVFEPFFRSVAARRAGKAGTGLGLAIAQRIATTLHGTLECVSTSGQGSCFTLRLPTPENPKSE
jgi:signal transduction histidine kinase